MHTRERVVPATVRVTTLKGVDAGLYYVEVLGGYYLDAGEPLGMWHGRGAERLGLVAEVDDDVFLSLMAGLHPETGEPLGRRYGKSSVRAFDVTASAPKSVSVLFAVGDDATRQAVLDAHDAAVGAMVRWIEDHAHARYRVDGEVMCFDAEGIVAATFRQHTSRALDPSCTPTWSSPTGCWPTTGGGCHSTPAPSSSTSARSRPSTTPACAPS